MACSFKAVTQLKRTNARCIVCGSSRPVMSGGVLPSTRHLSIASFRVEILVRVPRCPFMGPSESAPGEVDGALRAVRLIFYEFRGRIAKRRVGRRGSRAWRVRVATRRRRTERWRKWPGPGRVTHVTQRDKDARLQRGVGLHYALFRALNYAR